MGYSRHCDFLDFIGANVTRDSLSSPFLVRPRAPTTTGIISVFLSHILLASNPKSLFLDNFSVNFAKVLPSELLLLF